MITQYLALYKFIIIKTSYAYEKFVYLLNFYQLNMPYQCPMSDTIEISISSYVLEIYMKDMTHKNYLCTAEYNLVHYVLYTNKETFNIYNTFYPL